MNVPIVVVCYNNYKYVENTLKQILRINEHYYKNIIILDNSSNCVNTIHYLKNVNCKVIHNSKNNGPWINVNNNADVFYSLPDRFILTDPDLELNAKMPTNFIEMLVDVSEKYKIYKLGLALDIHDFDKMFKAAYAKNMNIYEWESQYWKKKLDDADYELYSAYVDTTFCLINKGYTADNREIRIAGDFTVKHLPWYTKNKIYDLYDNYLESKKTTHISSISKIIREHFENIPKVNKILLFGSSGMLGGYIYSYFKNTTIEIININYKVTNTNFDLLEQILIDNNINDTTCVINCIGLIPQRKSPESDKEYFLVNSIFPQLLWNICKKYNAKMIQPSTDCVFSGKKGKYIETDVHDETNSYGMSKSLGEPAGCTIIRTSIIEKEMSNKKSFLEWVISNNNKINEFTNHFWNGITCLQYCKIIEKMIRENIFWEGVRHIHSPTAMSKYEMASTISQVFNLNIEIIPTESEEMSDKTLLSNFNYFEIPELDVQIRDLHP